MNTHRYLNNNMRVMNPFEDGFSDSELTPASPRQRDISRKTNNGAKLPETLKLGEIDGCMTMEISNTTVSVKDIPKNSRLVFTGNGLIVVPSRLDGILVINGNDCEVCLEGLQGLAQGSVIINKTENTKNFEKELDDRTEVRNEKRKSMQNTANLVTLAEKRLKQQVRDLQKAKQVEEQRMQVECQYLKEQVRQLQEKMQVERQNQMEQVKQLQKANQIEKQRLQMECQKHQDEFKTLEQRMQVESQNLHEQVKQLQEAKLVDEKTMQAEYQKHKNEIKQHEDARQLVELRMQGETHIHLYYEKKLKKLDQNLQEELQNHKIQLKQLQDDPKIQLAKQIAEAKKIYNQKLEQERQNHKIQITQVEDEARYQVAKQVDAACKLINRKLQQERREFEIERERFYYDQLIQAEDESQRKQRELQEIHEIAAANMQIEENNKEQRWMEDQRHEYLEEETARHRILDQEIDNFISSIGGIINSENNIRIPVQKREYSDIPEQVQCGITLDPITCNTLCGVTNCNHWFDRDKIIE